jgi:hypothetical protein
MGLKLFEYAIIQQPKKDTHGKIIEQGGILVGVSTILAQDETHVQMVAAREVPEDAMDELDRLEVVVRPFERRVLGIAGARGASGPIGASGPSGSPSEEFTAYSMVAQPSTASYTPMNTITTTSSGADVSLWAPK